LLVSFTLTPMLCARFLKLKPGHAAGTRQRGFYAAIDRVYGSILCWSLQHRWVILLLSGLTVASTVPLFRWVGKDFLPQDDQSEFEIVAQTPEGYSLKRTC
jgi:HAE1 family hydrophobic/amphiphilic exporter-1